MRWKTNHASASMLWTELEKSYKSDNIGFTESAPIVQLREVQAALQAARRELSNTPCRFTRWTLRHALWILFHLQKRIPCHARAARIVKRLKA